MPTISVLNQITTSMAWEQFFSCCGSSKWAEEMTSLRPFESDLALFQSADEVWSKLEQTDRLEAFGQDPKIGEGKLTGKKAKMAATEQTGVKKAPPEVLKELEQLNLEYEKKFGFVFLICASGKSAQEMLDSLKERIKNTKEVEIANASNEQSTITRLRLGRWLQS